MKKVIIGFLLLFIVGTKLSAQTQDTTGIKYWYYPSQNYYYNEVSGDYWYWDQPTTKWLEGKKLPTTYRVTEKDDRYAVYDNGQSVWQSNPAHKTKYKVKTGAKTTTPPQR